MIPRSTSRCDVEGPGSLRSGSVPLRRLLLVLAPLTLVALGATGCADQVAAAHVGDEILSDSALMDEVKALADSDVALGLLGVPAEAVSGELGQSYNQEFVGFVLQRRISSMLYQQLLQQVDLEVTTEERDALAAQVETELQTTGAEVADLPERFWDQLVDDAAAQEKLQTSLDEADLAAAFEDVVAGTDIDVSSRYGSWDQEAFIAGELAVIPPEGPQAEVDPAADAVETP